MLGALLSEARVETSTCLMDVLGSLGNRAVRTGDVLLKMSKSTNRDLAIHAVCTYVRVTTREEEVLPVIEGYLASSERSDRLSAAFAAGAVRLQSRSIVRLLMEMLDGEDQRLCRQAAASLVRMGRPSDKGRQVLDELSADASARDSWLVAWSARKD
jgi:HEAT repeat protein